MTDAELIRGALLRAEKIFKFGAERDGVSGAMGALATLIIKTLREEVDKGLAQRECK